MPPARLAPEVAQAIAGVERDLTGSGRTDLTGSMWTLTWLEGRPIAELDRDTAEGEPIVVSVDAAGRITTASDEDLDDVW